MSEALRRAGARPSPDTGLDRTIQRAVDTAVDQRRRERRAEFLRRQTGERASPQARGDRIFQEHLPRGARMQRQAQTTQLGLSNGSNLYTAPIPYNYPHESPEREWFPKTRKIQVDLGRRVVSEDGLIATCIDILTELPFSEFDIKGPGVTGSVKRAYEDMIDRCGLVAKCQEGLRELFVTGEMGAHGIWDETDGMWRKFHFHPSDQLTVYDLPVFMQEPIVEWTPPDHYRDILAIDHPQMKKQRAAIPRDVLEAVLHGDSITLEPAAFTLIARKNAPDCARGTSILTRLWRAVVYQDALFHAAIQTARRMACFVAGTPVLTVAGIKNIEDITPGEKIIAGNGKVETVEGCWAQKPDGTGVVEIEALGTETLRCTLTHKFKVWSRPTTCACGCGQELEPLYTRPDGQTRTRKSAYVNGHHLRGLRNAKGQMTAGASADWKICCEQPKLRVPAWHEPIQKKEAWQLRPGDYFVIPRTFEPIETTVSPDAARVLGYFVAEGSERIRVTNSDEWTGVNFTFSLDEAETWARDVVDAAKRAADVDALHYRYVPGAHTQKAKSGRVGTTTVTIQRQKDAPFAQWLCDNGGVGANQHCLSEEVMRWPLELKREFIRGYFRGDGHWGFVDGCAQVSAITTSKTLAYQVRLILAQLGYFGAISHNPRAHIAGCENWSDAWVVSSTGRDARALADLIWGVEISAPENASTNRTWSDAEYVYVPIQKVKHEYGSIVTYNLSVSGDKSYLSAGIQTYNSPIKVAKLGDPGSDYYPPPEQERALKEALANSELDPGCFTPETPVSMADGSRRSVGSLVVGDKVLSRLGRIETVEATRIEPARELVRLSVVGADDIDCTTTHKWPIWGGPRVCSCGCGTPIKRGNFAPKHGMTGLGVKNEYWTPDGAPKKPDGMKLKFLNGFSPYQKVTADQIRKGDYLMIPRNFDEVQPTGVTADHARLLGLYAAEGSMRKDKRSGGRQNTGFVLSFCTDEEHTLVQDSIRIIERLTGRAPLVTFVPNEQTIQVRAAYDAAESLAQWLETHAGKYATEKKLSQSVMQWPLALKYEFIKGYVAGDGSSVAQKRSAKKIRYVEVGSASKTLLQQVQLICVQLGAYGSFSHRTQTTAFSAGNDFYRLHFHGEFAARLSRDVWGFDVEVPSKSQQWWADEHFVYVRVRDVARLIKPNGGTYDVVNLQVSGDHSYIAGGLATYNSWITWSWAIAFELIGVQERVLPITQHMPLVEQMILSAFGINKALILGEASYNSASAGLTIILQRLLALRNMLVRKWLVPKVFGMMAVANNWVLRSPAEVAHGLRINKAPEETRYIIPDLVWRKSLDSNIDSEKIAAIGQLKDIGARYSLKTLHALSGTDFEEETKNILAETKYRKQLAGNDPALLAALGGGEEGGAGGGAGGGMSPGIAPGVPMGDGGAGGLPPDAGAAPDGGAGGPSVSLDTGGAPSDSAPAPGAAADGPRDKPKPTNPTGDEPDDKTPDAYAGWPKEFVDAGVRLFTTFDPEEVRDIAPWDEILNDADVKSALDDGDGAELWDAVETAMAERDVPPQAIAAIANILASRTKKVARAALAARAAGRGDVSARTKSSVSALNDARKAAGFADRQAVQNEISALEETAGLDLYTGCIE